MIQPNPVISPNEVEPYDPDHILQNKESLTKNEPNTSNKNTINNLFSIGNKIEEKNDNNHEDLKKISRLMNLFGHDDKRDNLYNSVRRFQAANGLKIDGVVNPGGETEISLKRNISSLAKQYNEMRTRRKKPKEKDKGKPRQRPVGGTR